MRSKSFLLLVYPASYRMITSFPDFFLVLCDGGNGIRCQNTKFDCLGIVEMPRLAMVSGGDFITQWWDVERCKESYNLDVRIFFAFLVCNASGKALRNFSNICLIFYEGGNK